MSIFLSCFYEHPTTAVKGSSGEEWEWGVPSQPIGSLRERRKLPSGIWGVSSAILCDFTHLLVHLTAAWKWEIPTSRYWLVGLIFP